MVFVFLETMLYCLTTLWAGQGIAVIVLLAILKRDFRETWIPYVIFDGIVVILTMYKVFSYRGHMNTTIRLLARDSIVYFIIMFCTFLFNALGENIQGVVTSLPGECVACIAVARMMMNIRGLVFDDPYGSQGMKLSTIEFRVPPESSVSGQNGGFSL